MTFRLVPKSVTLNDLERRNGVILRYFIEFDSFRGALSSALSTTHRGLRTLHYHCCSI